MKNQDMFGWHSTPKYPGWQVYEVHKKQIIAKNLPYHEYEKAIRKLVEASGGETSLSNLQTMCKSSNSKKGTKVDQDEI